LFPDLVFYLLEVSTLPIISIELGRQPPIGPLLASKPRPPRVVVLTVPFISNCACDFDNLADALCPVCAFSQPSVLQWISGTMNTSLSIHSSCSHLLMRSRLALTYERNHQCTFDGVALVAAGLSRWLLLITQRSRTRGTD